MPASVYLLAATIFAVTTSEFMVAGMMPTLAEAFSVSVGEIGYLISLFALGMAIGGPMVTALLLALRTPNKQALLWMLGLFLAGSVLAALAPSYSVMAIARVIQGVSSAACFGISMTICAELVRPEMRGRAVSFVLAGLMLSPVVGVPLTALINQTFGWQASFWSVVGLAILCTAVVTSAVPASKRGAVVDLAAGLSDLKSGRLWAAYTTSGLVIGATFAAFSYFSAIFTEVAGFTQAAIPALLAAYGAANVVGNLVVGRFADRFTIPVLIGGLILLAIALATFAFFASNPVISVVSFIMIGLTGVSLNPAMVTRVMRTAHPGPLVNSMHASMITAGLALGTWAGGFGIDAGYGLNSPLWIGFVLALAGLVTLVPASVRRLDP
ncbi:MFS transporter [Agrobacterium tumefaciens]|uniref:MFS transporter n=1 Tax=Agrobacterium tumefaciens TaxID=358 RepID=A0AAP9J729_AGRTU|nr:MFS transporter [Agrobacterium tumefaciens]QDY95456.1 MFS transporter [Agrobacterium tumefaciens]UXS50549.1 MFS transporter [Agrobacterium tumefaciens]UXS71792.1 MFS transporter [Agrobacterium tumefaciens]UXS79459.1 MFS transporter [Agrobacterium tumefaciens]